MTTQLPTLGTSTPSGYQPAPGPAPTAPAVPGAPATPATPKPAAGAVGSTPGAGASIAAPDTSALGQDPAYLAYLRALGVADTTHSAGIQGQIDALNRNVQLRLPQMQQDAAFANNRLLGGMEARGVLNSGETANNLAQQQSLQQRAQGALQDSAAQRTADLINQLAEFRANQGVGNAERGLTASQTVANNNGTQQINNQAAAIGTALGI